MEKIGKYELREILGRGGMGVVYRAYDPVIDREVAVKVIQEKAVQSSETKARFIREARMAGRFSHENITVIHDLGEEDGKMFIVMEFLKGHDLRTVIDRKDPLTLQDKLSYARQICRGLHYAHANGIIHRDIKPENIKVLADGRIKIMDFGIAKPYTPEEMPLVPESDQVLTRVGMRIGTPWYMSPEQVKGTLVDKRSDIFSFGVLLYELLTYQKPFQGDDTTVLYKILHEDPPPIPVEESGLGMWLQRILTKCLEKTPEKRYADCLIILRDLDSAPGPQGVPLLYPGTVASREDLPTTGAVAEATRAMEEIGADGPAARRERLPLGVNLEPTLPAPRPPELAIGAIVSHFRILGRISGGGMGVVYKAEDMTLKRIVALKFLQPEWTLNPDAKKRFLKEAQAASGMDHPNVCTIHEIGETPEGMLFICMAFYEGENLGTRIQKGPLPATEGLRIAIGVARGLDKAHQHKIVHRDIKPANILLTADGGVKIVDFGLAKLTLGTRITRPGSMLGTLPYMSPEQVKGQNLDHRADIWALGVLLFQMLTGRLPFEHPKEDAVFYAIVNTDPPSVSSIRPDLPTALDPIVSRALRKTLEERYSSVAEFLHELEKVSSDMLRPAAIAASGPLAGLIEKGRKHLEQREYAEAMTHFEAALKLMPGDPQILGLRAQSQKQQAIQRRVDALIAGAKDRLQHAKSKEARKMLQEALALDPENTSAAGLLDDVIKDISGAERIAKLLQDATLAQRQNRAEEAAALFREILALEPAHKEARRGLQTLEKRESPAPRPATDRRGLWKRPVLLMGAGIVAILSGMVWLVLRPSPSPVTVTSERPIADSSVFVASARKDMLDEKEAAGRANAASLAASTHAEAQDIERRADRAASGKNFATARQLYEEAGRRYRAAAEESRRAQAAATTSLSELKRLVAGAREEMRAKKQKALEAGGTGASNIQSYRTALEQEREGDRLAASGDQQSLLASRNAYSNAREGYTRAAAEATLRAESRNLMEAAAAQSRAARQRVPGSDVERQSSPSYRAAMDCEARAARYTREEDYQKARDEYEQATRLFASAGREVLAARSGPKDPQLVSADGPAADHRKEPEKPDPTVKESENRETAQREIRRLLEEYRVSIEKGNLKNLTTLLSLNADKQQEWSDFFGASDDRKVSLDVADLQVSGATANVSFRVRMAFFNEAANTTQSIDNVRQWSLQNENGVWKIHTHK